MDLKTRKYFAIEKIMAMDTETLSKLERSIDLILTEGTSLEEYNKEIEEADAAIEQGDFVTHLDAIKEIQAWRKQ